MCVRFLWIWLFLPGIWRHPVFVTTIIAEFHFKFIIIASFWWQVCIVSFAFSLQDLFFCLFWLITAVRIVLNRRHSRGTLWDLDYLVCWARTMWWAGLVHYVYRVQLLQVPVHFTLMHEVLFSDSNRCQTLIFRTVKIITENYIEIQSLIAAFGFLSRTEIEKFSKCETIFFQHKIILKKNNSDLILISLLMNRCGRQT